MGNAVTRAAAGRFFATALALMSFTLPIRGMAVSLQAGILSDAAAPEPDSQFTVDHFLKLEKRSDGKVERAANGDPVYTLNFEEKKAGGKSNLEFVDVLNNSIDLSSDVRHQIASEIVSLGDICDLDKLGMAMWLAPIPGLANKEINVKDSRRIAHFAIYGCLKAAPKECGYNSTENDDSGIELSGLLVKIRQCRNALVAVYNTHPEAFEGIKATNPASENEGHEAVTPVHGTSVSILVQSGDRTTIIDIKAETGASGSLSFQSDLKKVRQELSESNVAWLTRELGIIVGSDNFNASCYRAVAEIEGTLEGKPVRTRICLHPESPESKELIKMLNTIAAGT